MSQGGSQTKRKRDATTGSTAKVHYNWEKEFELWCDVTEVDRVSRESIKGFISQLLKTQREETIKEEHEICKKIHLIELNRWSIYEPNADECFEEEYQSLTNKREIIINYLKGKK